MKMSDHLKHLLDGAAITVAFATFVSWLPSIAAALSIIWTILRIWEMDTVKRWTGRSKP